MPSNSRPTGRDNSVADLITFDLRHAQPAKAKPLRVRVFTVYDSWGTRRYRAIVLCGRTPLHVGGDFPIEAQAREHGNRKRDELRAHRKAQAIAAAGPSSALHPYHRTEE